jgi:thioredoxin-like negative regulator of GroEL
MEVRAESGQAWLIGVWARKSNTELTMMLSRRVFNGAMVAALVTAGQLASAWASTVLPFSADAFKAAQASGNPILVEIHADWCPTCKAQSPILDKLTADPKFKDLKIFRVDFDAMKPVVKQFGAQMQSTLIVFKGASEQGRSVGDTREASIAALLDKSL